MITITNDTKNFIEIQSGEIFVYGAGNAGYWVGYYMNRCKIDFTAYLDQKVFCEDAKYNDKPVFIPHMLKKYTRKSIRIIVTPRNYEKVLADLLWLDHLYEFNALCLVPRFIHVSTHEEGYNINKLLSYFRGKLFIGDTPTIISNNCSAGFIYDMIDRVMLSPTINTGIEPNDFIKICKNPNQYFHLNMDEIKWERVYGNPQIDEDEPVGIIDDVKIQFSHVESTEGLADRWNYMCGKINWNRLIYVACEHDVYLPFSIKNEKEFMELKEEHLMIVMRNSAFWGGSGYNKVFMQQNYLASTDSAIENYFDLLGWLNREYLSENE